MRVVFDIEANGLVNPTRIWCVVCKDIDKGDGYVFREQDREKFLEWSKGVEYWVGHNILQYDFPVLGDLWGLPLPREVCDTLILSRLLNYSRPGGHSLASYGEEFGLKKIGFYDFSKWTQEMEDYCVRDVDICLKLFNLLYHGGSDGGSVPGLDLEQRFQSCLNKLHSTGFGFNTSEANVLLTKVKGELDELDKELASAFPPRAKPIREVHPKLTKYGTLNRSDFRFVKDGNLSEYNGGPFTRIEYIPFNASSPKQVVEVLNKAGWSPIEKTDTHIDVLRQLAKMERMGRKGNDGEISELRQRLSHFSVYGWKVNEANLSTLPVTAPRPAYLLSKRIVLESRRRTLVEWLSLVVTRTHAGSGQQTSRIHGEFMGLGAWSHRMAHQKPNLANIPNEYKEDGSIKLLGKELRSLWGARTMLGVDAEGIQLRIFAHYVNNKELIESLVNGRKDNKTDPHSLNASILGCTRAQAKRFLYALLLGGGIGRFSQILECSKGKAEEAVDKFNKRYPGFAHLKRYVIPSDAKRGFFEGLDGRRVPIPGADFDERKHLAMSGYLQCGEAIVIKKAALHFIPEIEKYDCFLVDIIHDEYQIECPSKEVAIQIAPIVADSITWAGKELGLNCPLAGSYLNDHQEYTIGPTWYHTH